MALNGSNPLNSHWGVYYSLVHQVDSGYRRHARSDLSQLYMNLMQHSHKQSNQWRLSYRKHGRCSTTTHRHGQATPKESPVTGWLGNHMTKQIMTKHSEA